MMPELRGRCVVGAKQLMRQIRAGQVESVYIADDADAHITSPVIGLCAQSAIPLTRIDTMKSLGTACGIDVPAAAAGALKSPATPPH